MPKKFNEDDNSKIHNACNAIRALITVSSAVEGLKNPGSGIGNITDKTGKGSIINSLIQGMDWKNLFLNKEWLSVLEGAQNLNFVNGGLFKEHLIIVAKFFPEETEGSIILELL